MAIWINSSYKEDSKEDNDFMGMAVGSAMKEDLQEERERLKDDSLAVGSAMKEDLERNQ